MRDKIQRGKKSLKTVQKVLRIYTPEVVSVINRLLKGREAEGVSPMSTPSNKMLAGMVKRHEKNLGPFAPPSMSLSLSSCQDDMKNLLEEIFLQHCKKVESLDFFSRTFASIFGSGAYLREEKELHMLTKKAKIVVGFAPDYEVVPKINTYNACNAKDTSCDGSDRAVGGYFSESGRAQVIKT